MVNERPTGHSSALAEYRKGLVDAHQRSQSDFDKSLFSLSGGALGVSFAFVKNFLAGRPPASIQFLVVAWFCWVLSLALVLFSHYFSVEAIRRAVAQVDEGTIVAERLGGWFGRTVRVLNALGGIGFIAGLIAMGVFVARNV